MNTSRTIILRSLATLALIASPFLLAASSPGVQPHDPGHQKMLALLSDIVARTPEDNPYIGDKKARALRAELAALPETIPAIIKWEVYYRLGEAELDLGREQEAIESFLGAYRLLREVETELAAGWRNRLFYRMGVAYTRLGETQNCCLRNAPESCILPIRGNAIHIEREGSLRAVECFTEVLQNSSEDTLIHMSARWLLNIAFMTLGAHPGGVPEAYLIPPEAFDSDEPFPRFANIAPRVGLDTFSLSGSAIADDFDTDGRLDLLVSTWDPAGQIRLFRNRGSWSFEDRTEPAGLTGITGGLNMLQADYDNDGDVDVLVLRGAWLSRSGLHPNSLLRNNGDGTFTDVTFDSGLGEEHFPTQTASWADYDNDGDLDLYIGNETYDGVTAPCQLLRNDGDGTFTDVAREAGVENLRFAKAVIWGDYDADTFTDLYVSNLKGANRLYHNNGDGTFTDVATELGVDGPVDSFPAWFWDFDNDGALDLFVSAYIARIGHLAAAYLGQPLDIEMARLYRGDGQGSFEDVALEQNLKRPNAPMGSNFGDLDNDGYLDFYLGTGYPDYQDVMPNVMFRNRSGESFADVTTAGGFAHLQKGHAIAFADLDHDGDQDVFEQMGGALPGDGFYDVLYENPGFGNQWIGVKLIGRQSNRSAQGARLRFDIDEGDRRRTVYKHVSSGGTFGANPLEQMVGLGRAKKIERLEVWWPTSGLTQTFHDPPLGRRIAIVEGGTRFTVLP